MNNKYTRTVWQCDDDEHRKELTKLVKKRYYERNIDLVKKRNRLYYLKKKEQKQLEVVN